MSNVPRLTLGTLALLAALQIGPADAQGNIDAGKSPAQIFGDTCSACHRSARDFRRLSLGFLRAHYTTGPDEAAAMANYLAGLMGSDPRPSSQPGQPKRPPADVGKQPPRQTVEQARPPQMQGPAKGRPAAASAQARVVPEERPPEPPLAPPVPVLEPFEE